MLRKTGSLVYCAMPLPMAKGRWAKSRSRRAPAEHLRVEGDDDRVAAARLGAREEARDQLVRGAPVELEPARRVAHRLGARPPSAVRPGSRRSSARPRRRRPSRPRRRPRCVRARARRSARSGTASAAGGRRARPTGRGRRRRAGPRDDLPAVERGAVGGDRPLGAGAAGDVRVGLAPHPAPRGYSSFA